ncbi:unnamed protein product [Schistosoma margrebowiei]|uniref:Uncharacterized protein n=1 Tax=Schistosoma margrebowiei TaxID=48269 RepID=A0A183MB07_9TREM|nr:unnamed protein product [Schistosoma margrebowiei]
MFRLRYDVNRFVISSSRMMHNHPCDEKCLKNDPWFRRLNEDQLKVVRPMVETGSNANSIVKYAEYHFGKTITVPYVNNLKYKVVKRKLIPYIYGILDCGSLNDVIATLRDSGKVFVSYGVDLVLTLCCRWTWTACGDVDVNIPAISSPDYTETNRLYRILCSKIHTLSTLFEQTTVQDILRQLIDQVDELIRMRCLPTDSEHSKSTGSLDIKI